MLLLMNAVKKRISYLIVPLLVQINSLDSDPVLTSSRGCLVRDNQQVPGMRVASLAVKGMVESKAVVQSCEQNIHVTRRVRMLKKSKLPRWCSGRRRTMCWATPR